MTAEVRFSRTHLASASRVFAAIVSLAILVSVPAALAADVPVATVPVGVDPVAIAVDPVSHNVFVADYGGDSVSIIDGVSRSFVASLPMPTGGSAAFPIAAAFDVLNGKAYVGTFYSNFVSVIDGSDLSVAANIAMPYSHASGVRALAIDPTGATSKVYAAVFGKGIVTVIDGSTDTILKSIAVGSAPRALAVFASGSRRRVYVANRYSDNVSVIDGVTDSVVATVPTGVAPKVIAVDPDTGFVYVTSPTSDNVTVIDDRDEATATIPVGDNPIGVGVDTAGRRVFVANYYGNSVSVIDADTLSVVATVTTGVNPYSIAVDQSSRKAYVSCYGGGSVTVIDSSLAAISVAVGDRPYALGIDEGLASHQVYAGNWGGDTVTIIDPPGGDSGPITVTIDPLPGDATAASAPVLTGTAGSSREPYSSAIVAVLYRLDEEQVWRRAEIAGGAGTSSVRWRAEAGALDAGAHTIEVAAMDQALAVSSSSDQGAGGASAALGGGTSYAFGIDRTPPDVAIFGVADGATYDTTVVPTAASSDPSATVTAVLDGFPFILGSEVTSEGTHTLVVHATDPAGNAASATVTFHLSLTPPDTTPPTVSIITGPLAPDGTNGWFVSIPLISLAADEPAVISQSLSSATGPWTPYLIPFAATEGSATLYAYGVDSSGNTSIVVSRPILVDLNDPITMDDAPSTPTSAAVSVSLTASDAVSGVANTYFSLNGSAPEVYTGSIVVTASGDWVLTYLSVDVAGNVESTKATSFTIDRTAPDVFVLGVTDDESYNSTVTPTAISSDPSATVTAMLDGLPFTLGSDFSIEGTHTLVAKATDPAGNTASATVVFAIATETPPTLRRYEETASGLVWVGPWRRIVDRRMSGGTFRTTSASGSTVDVTFRGASLAVIGPRGTTYGIANVYVDGVLVGEMDCYAARPAYKQVLKRIDGLADTQHTVRIEVTHRKAARAKSHYIGIDAFDIVGVLLAP
jgi:YVTN family beta-propeller protein